MPDVETIEVIIRGKTYTLRGDMGAVMCLMEEVKITLATIKELMQDPIPDELLPQIPGLRLRIFYALCENMSPRPSLSELKRSIFPEDLQEVWVACLQAMAAGNGPDLGKQPAPPKKSTPGGAKRRGRGTRGSSRR